MESISNLASTAAKTIWGDTDANREPVAGAQGDVSKGEPYDAGNLSSAEQKNIENRLGGDVNTQSNPEIGGQAGTQAGVQTGGQAESQTGGLRGTQTEGHTDSHSGTQAEGLTGHTEGETDTRPGQKTGTDDVTDATPGEKTDTDKDPNAEAPKHDPKVPAEGEEEVELTGAGPRPLVDVAKEHGGDAGNRDDSSSSLPKGNSGDSTEEIKDDNNGESKGTGEEYVKTSGLAADGGDFDATKPGAGREADRLLEEKGVKREEKDSKPSDKLESTSSGSSAGKDKSDKPSLTERIKNKLHRH